jgi:hypothetical protein
MHRAFGYIGCLIVGAASMAGVNFFYTRYTSPPPSVKADTCLLAECLDGAVTYPIDELQEGERITLIELGLEQQRLENLIASMVERFGQTMQPFAAVWRIEQVKSAELQGIFDKYGVPTAKVPAGSLGESLATTPRAACVQALDQVRHLQERLFNERNAFAMRPDIRRFMQDSAQVSRDTLLPAFERCAKQE